MKEIYVNLKRFDVPRAAGGVCPLDDPVAWIEGVMRQTVDLGLAAHPGLQLVYLLPEGLVPPARRVLSGFPAASTPNLHIGCQGVHWDDVAAGTNFGAFTTAVPAIAARNLGSSWAIIGHSEERRFKTQVIQAFEPAVESEPELQSRAAGAVDRLIHAEVRNALHAGLNVLLCIGETAAQRGEGSFAEQQDRIRAVLQAQLLTDLEGLAEISGERKVTIGYEPVWAIGPGKTPPGKEYIQFVSTCIKEIVGERLGRDLPVVYGGGLKQENAGMIASIETIAGGLVALTRFSGEIGFSVAELKAIIEQYL